MKLLIFGPPGSGKGTYSTRVAAALKIPRIVMSDLLREESKKGSQLGKLIAIYMDKGQFAPDDAAIKLFKERLKKPDVKKGFISDGFPRNVAQAKEFDITNKFDAVIGILAAKEILIEKITARRICSNSQCDGNFNIADIHKTIDGVEYILPPLLPKKKGICDKCGSKLFQRKDDMIEVIGPRLEVFEEQTKPLYDYYEGKVPFIKIYMNRAPEIIVANILEEIKKLKLS
jgi:adenylate kinase